MTNSKPLALSVKVIVRDGAGECLLLKRSMLSKNNPGKWDFPGGKIDPGEAFDQALAREVFEETGLKIFIDGVAGVSQGESQTNRVIHLILEGSRDSGELRLSEEHEEYAWVKIIDVPKMDLAPQFIDFAEGYAREAEGRGHCSVFHA